MVITGLTRNQVTGTVRGSNPTLSAMQNQYGYSSVGRALEWHSRGQEFEPPYLHQGAIITGLIVPL